MNECMDLPGGWCRVRSLWENVSESSTSGLENCNGIQQYTTGAEFESRFPCPPLDGISCMPCGERSAGEMSMLPASMKDDLERGAKEAMAGLKGRKARNILFFFFFFHLTYSRWTSSLPSCLWSQKIFPTLPGSRLTIFLSRCKFSTLTTRQPMVEFYLLTFPRFPLRKKEHKSYFGKNRTHDFRTSRCAAYLLDHSGDERYYT